MIGNRYGPGTGTIWLDDVHCVGNERSITACTRADFNEINCRHNEDVSVSCGTSPAQFGNVYDDHVQWLKCKIEARICMWSGAPVT